MSVSPDFIPAERALVESALADLARYAPAGASGITVLREDFMVKGWQTYATVLGEFLPSSRSAVLYAPAFLGPGSITPLAPQDAVRAVLAPSLLLDVDRRGQWLQLCGVDPQRPVAAAILEARQVAEVLAGAERGEGLQLQGLPPEAAFGLAYALYTRGRDGFVKARPDMAAFLAGPWLAPALPDPASARNFRT